MTSTETDPRLEGEGGDIATAVGNAPETSGITFTSIEELFTFIIRDILGDDASSIDFYLGKEAIKPSTVDFENLFDLFLKRAELGSPEREAVVRGLEAAGAIDVGSDVEEGIAYWTNTSVEQLGVDVDNFVSANTNFFLTGGTIGGDDEDDGTGEGGTTGPGGAAIIPGIMAGGTLTKVTRQGAPDLWAMTYTVGSVQHVYTFDSQESMLAILGDDAITSGKFGFLTLPWETINDGDTWLLGSAEAFSGQEGSYQIYFDDIMQEAGLEAGIRNPGMLGRYLSDPKIQQIIAEGEAGQWSAARIQAEIRNTDFYQNTLYPGIINILNSGVGNPGQEYKAEIEYLRYMQTVTPSLRDLGYQPDEDGTYRSTVGNMLNGGVDDQTFVRFTPVFIRAEQSQDFAGVLNQWTQRDLGKSLDFEDWFDVLDGTSGAELAQVVEKATIQFQSDRAGSALDADTIARLAELTDLSEAQMGVAFGQAEQALLSIGNKELARFGLTQEALTNAAFGVETVGPDPLSSAGDPMSAQEVQRRARKAATELSIADDRKAQFFVGFDRFGRPQRQGLSAVAPETG